MSIYTEQLTTWVWRVFFSLVGALNLFCLSTVVGSMGFIVVEALDSHSSCFCNFSNFLTLVASCDLNEFRVLVSNWTTEMLRMESFFRNGFFYICLVLPSQFPQCLTLSLLLFWIYAPQSHSLVCCSSIQVLGYHRFLRTTKYFVWSAENISCHGSLGLSLLFLLPNGWFPIVKDITCVMFVVELQVQIVLAILEGVC